jgi:hypothetical protein
MKKRIFVLLIILSAIILLFIIAYNTNILSVPKKNISGNAMNANSNSNVKMQKVTVTKENFPQILQSQSIVQELSKNSKILLKLYNFNTGERQWEESYVIKKGSVELGTIDDPDITVILSSKYIAYGDFCTIAKNANSKGDLGYQTSMGKVQLMIKYGNLMKYKDCF